MWTNLPIRKDISLQSMWSIWNALSMNRYRSTRECYCATGVRISALRKKTSTNVEFVLIPLENSEKENTEDRPQGSLGCVSQKFYVCSYVTTDNIKYQSSPSLSRKKIRQYHLGHFFFTFAVNTLFMHFQL